MAKPQAGRRACGPVLSRRPAKISEPKSAARPTVQRCDLWRYMPPPVRTHLRPRSSADGFAPQLGRTGSNCAAPESGHSLPPGQQVHDPTNLDRSWRRDRFAKPVMRECQTGVAAMHLWQLFRYSLISDPSRHPHKLRSRSVTAISGITARAHGVQIVLREDAPCRCNRSERIAQDSCPRTPEGLKQIYG